MSSEPIYRCLMPLREYLTITVQLALYAVAGLMALISGLVFFPIALIGLFSLFRLTINPPWQLSRSSHGVR